MRFLRLFIFTIYELYANESNSWKTVRNSGTPVEAEWKHLDNRPLPRWYDAEKIGILVHWGVYSVPSFKSEWFWYCKENNDKEIVNFMHNHYPSVTSYTEFASMFTAELFKPKDWADLFVKSGAKYVVLTAKHHDGFKLFKSINSVVSNWNSMDFGPKMDVVERIAKAVRKRKMKFGVYYSLLQWFDNMYYKDIKSEFLNTDYVDKTVWPDLKQLILDYKPSVLWVDGEWEASDTYWKSKELITWLYNSSPVKKEIVVNDRWGADLRCQHGDFYSCDNIYNPGSFLEHKWERVISLDKYSSGFRRHINITDIISIKELLQSVVFTVSYGGNALIGIGPTKDGIIAPIFQERLLQLGEWLHVNGEAIYETSPFYKQYDSLNSDVWYTCKKKVYNPIAPTALPSKIDMITRVYAFFFNWPNNNSLAISDLSSYIRDGAYQIFMLGAKEPLTWQSMDRVLEVALPNKAEVASNYAWTLQIIRM